MVEVVEIVVEVEVLALAIAVAAVVLSTCTPYVFNVDDRIRKYEYALTHVLAPNSKITSPAPFLKVMRRSVAPLNVTDSNRAGVRPA